MYHMFPECAVACLRDRPVLLPPTGLSIITRTSLFTLQLRHPLLQEAFPDSFLVAHLTTQLPLPLPRETAPYILQRRTHSPVLVRLPEPAETSPTVGLQWGGGGTAHPWPPGWPPALPPRTVRLRTALAESERAGRPGAERRQRWVQPSQGPQRGGSGEGFSRSREVEGASQGPGHGGGGRGSLLKVQGGGL